MHMLRCFLLYAVLIKKICAFPELIVFFLPNQKLWKRIKDVGMYFAFPDVFRDGSSFGKLNLAQWKTHYFVVITEMF